MNSIMTMCDNEHIVICRVGLLNRRATISIAFFIRGFRPEELWMTSNSLQCRRRIAIQNPLFAYFTSNQILPFVFAYG